MIWRTNSSSAGATKRQKLARLQARKHHCRISPPCSRSSQQELDLFPHFAFQQPAFPSIRFSRGHKNLIKLLVVNLESMMKIVTHCISPPVRQLFKNQATLGIILAVYLLLLMLSFVCLCKDVINPNGKDSLCLKYFQLIPLSAFFQSLSLNMKLLFFLRINTLIGTFNEKNLKKSYKMFHIT